MAAGLVVIENSLYKLVSGVIPGGQRNRIRIWSMSIDSSSGWVLIPRLFNANFLGLQNQSTVTMRVTTYEGLYGIRSFAELTNHFFEAVEYNVSGDSISLVFDGVLTVKEVVDAWNLANPTNTVSVEGTTTTVLAAQTVNLTGWESPDITKGWGLASGAELFMDAANNLPVYVKYDSGTANVLMRMEIS